VCERLVQNRYPAMRRPGVDRKSNALTTTIPKHSAILKSESKQKSRSPGQQIPGTKWAGAASVERMALRPPSFVEMFIVPRNSTCRKLANSKSRRPRFIVCSANVVCWPYDCCQRVGTPTRLIYYTQIT